MSVLTLRLPDDKHARLRRLAETRGISMNRLVDEWATIALTQFDAETRFRALAAAGRPARGLALLDKLDTPASPAGPSVSRAASRAKSTRRK